MLSEQVPSVMFLCYYKKLFLTSWLVFHVIVFSFVHCLHILLFSVYIVISVCVAVCDCCQFIKA